LFELPPILSLGVCVIVIVSGAIVSSESFSFQFLDVLFVADEIESVGVVVLVGVVVAVGVVVVGLEVAAAVCSVVRSVVTTTSIVTTTATTTTIASATISAVVGVGVVGGGISSDYNEVNVIPHGDVFGVERQVVSH